MEKTQTRQRRRSSLMYDYFKENYMGMQKINESHIADIEATFKLLDSDNDGKLKKEEIDKLLRYLGILKSDSEMEELLRPIDTDHNGYIDFEEFEKYVIDNKVLEHLCDETYQEMKDAFNVFDKDGDGFIDREELKRVLTQIGDKMPDEVADDFIKQADLNGDGKIDYREFCLHMGY